MSISLRTGELHDAQMDARRRAVVDRLATATEALLIAQPVGEISLTDIVKASRVAKATVYKLFNDKQHVLQVLAERLLKVCRSYQLSNFDDVDPEDWRDVYTRLCHGASVFYHERPAAIRLWLANDSPASIRAVDQASDAAFLAWIHNRFSDTAWHARLPDPLEDVDVLTGAFRIYDAILTLGFSRAGHAVPQRVFDEAKRASLAYLSSYLDAPQPGARPPMKPPVEASSPLISL